MVNMLKDRFAQGSRVGRNNMTAFLFLAPWLIGIFVFTLWPFITSFTMSLQETNLFVSKWVGLENYKQLLSDRDLLNRSR